MVFLSMWVWQYADKVNYLAYFKNDFERDEAAYKNEMEQFRLFLVIMMFYGTMALYYNFRALTVPATDMNQKKRFSQYASGLVLIVSGMSAAVVVFPAES